MTFIVPRARRPTVDSVALTEPAAKPRWPAIRASLIGLAILVGLVDGCPLPPEPYVTWQRPIVDVVRPVQQKVLAPFTWVSRGLRVTQRWALMQVAPRERYRFTVEGRTAVDGQWRVLYRANDPDHAELADMLESHHVWAVWNPTDRLMSQYAAFIRWFTAHVLAIHPELDAVRTGHEKVLLEDGELHGTGELTSVMTRTRSGR